jgi:rod shape determining protein RodA
VLYSAAGGSLRPWALNQGIRFFVLFFGGDRAVAHPRGICGNIRFPGVRRIVVAMLVGVELLGAVAAAASAGSILGIIRLQPSELMKPMIVLACAKFYEMLPAQRDRDASARSGRRRC